jgi:hypothetical protein
MIRRRLAALAFALSVVLCLAHALGYSTVLPDRVATRFDSSGVPVGWASRSTMIDLQLTMIVALAAACLVLAGAVLRSPARWLGVPRREWWLAPERSEDTRQDLAVRLLWLGVLGQLLLGDLFHRAVRVNLGRAPALESPWLDLGVFACGVAVWLGMLIWRYRQAPATAA